MSPPLDNLFDLKKKQSAIIFFNTVCKEFEQKRTGSWVLFSLYIYTFIVITTFTPFLLSGVGVKILK